MSRRHKFPYQGAGLTDHEAETQVSAAFGPEEEQEPDLPEEFSPETFLLICDAPRDGAVLEVKMDPDDPDDRAVMAIWRSTTVYDKEMRRWRRIGYWADPITKRQLDGEPIVFRLASAVTIMGTMVG